MFHQLKGLHKTQFGTNRSLRVLEEITVSVCGCKIARRLDSSRLQTKADRLSFPRVNGAALNRPCLDCDLIPPVA